MYFPEIRPWLVGMPLKPPPDVLGRLPLAKGVDCRCDELGRIELATLASALPVDKDACGCCGLKAFRCCSGKANPCPS